jgi:hypothetical protein
MKFPDRPSPRRAGARGEIQALFVARLERLIRLRKDYRDDLNPLGLRLLDRAIQATYRDCVDYGAADRARSVLGTHPVPELD